MAAQSIFVVSSGKAAEFKAQKPDAEAIKRRKELLAMCKADQMLFQKEKMPK